MAFTHTFGYTWTDGSQTLNGNVSKTGDSELAQDFSIANGGGTVTKDIKVDSAQIVSLFILSDQDCNIVLGGTTFATKANVPFTLIKGGSNLISADATAITFSQNVSLTINVKCRFLFDSTITPS